MRVDVVGGVQALAEEWATADRELAEARKRVEQAEREREQVRTRAEHAAKLLSERVGRNLRELVFLIGDEVVIVEHERGIRRQRIEK